MKKLVYSPDYRDKIIRLKNELDLKYGQPVRKKVLSEINHHIHLLKAHSFLGTSLRDMYGIDCDYYYLYISPNLVFYEVEQDSINILNIYHEREDYIIKFLGSVSKLHEGIQYPDK
jgi:plasmid stabilization system protein ParE